jgi:hypothetical protein
MKRKRGTTNEPLPPPPPRIPTIKQPKPKVVGKYDHLIEEGFKRSI